MAGDRGDRPARSSDYRVARIAAALLLTCTLGLLLVLDAVLPDYDVQPVTLFALLGAIGSLLGVEILRTLRDRL